jgi:hypothetical protein
MLELPEFPQDCVTSAIHLALREALSNTFIVLDKIEASIDGQDFKTGRKGSPPAGD